MKRWRDNITHRKNVSVHITLPIIYVEFLISLTVNQSESYSIISASYNFLNILFLSEPLKGNADEGEEAD